jgi:hypothetical protein
MNTAWAVAVCRSAGLATREVDRETIGVPRGKCDGKSEEKERSIEQDTPASQKVPILTPAGKNQAAGSKVTQ